MKLIALLLILLPAFSLQAQKGILSFKEKEVELKDLKADDVATTVTFEFKNTGTAPLMITRVIPMSSQLKAEWDGKPVLPGKSSVIKVAFVSSKMPVDFNYGITVLSNVASAREIVRIRGNVVDNPKKPDLMYKFSLDGLKFKSGHVSFNNVNLGEIVKDTVYFYNSREKTVKVAVPYKPSYVKAEVIPQELKKGEKGMLVLTFDATQKVDYGYVYDAVILSLDGDNSYRNRLSVSAHVQEDFSKLTPEQRAKAPAVTFDKNTIEFGEIKQGEKVDCDFEVKNTGKSDLIIRKTKASCGCTAVTLGESTLAPGESTKIRATFNSAGRNGRQYKSITVITNDPQKPEVILTISGNIVNTK